MKLSASQYVICSLALMQFVLVFVAVICDLFIGPEIWVLLVLSNTCPFAIASLAKSKHSFKSNFFQLLLLNSSLFLPLIILSIINDLDSLHIEVVTLVLILILAFSIFNALVFTVFPNREEGSSGDTLYNTKDVLLQPKNNFLEDSQDIQVNTITNKSIGFRIVFWIIFALISILFALIPLSVFFEYSYLEWIYR